LVGSAIAGALLAGTGIGSRSAPPAAPRALLIGGGPSLKYNQAGIESNVRYVSRILPPDTLQTILFADGNPKRATVQYEKGSEAASQQQPNPGEDAFDALFEVAGDADSGLDYRPPRLKKIDGPTRRASITSAFDQLSHELSDSDRPLFLYFTGHGSASDSADPNNTHYELWGEDSPLTVRQLAAELQKIPTGAPVVLVMVQCFSGGFGNLLFEGGRPDAPLVKRDFAGFFAATPDRMSAGCTPSLNESEYKDFTSYFFSALSGQDRVGRKVSVADYNKDGRVGMDEAFDYSLVADESVDVPVSTSDVFLRRFVPADEDELFNVPYSQVLGWARPGQHAALEGLSRKLSLTGEDRLKSAYAEVEAEHFRPTRNRATLRRFSRAKSALYDPLTAKYPELGGAQPLQPASKTYASLRAKAVKWLNDPARAAQVKEVLAADDALSDEEEGTQYSVHSTLNLRFVRLGKSVILAHRLMASQDANLIAQWKRLQASEARSPLGKPVMGTSRKARL
jgi:hypothetical protein